ncbi:MAG: class I SAM-dependent methyltransferase [SAR86 cluster bacterium]|jgi:ubiquinone/menaquinone biosynthesis C-methylase UbiE|uniref:Class I SAM-dependent methyltransferase n=1 Tax=SAR86 cluster bacterium TaxID=2030880 RepID=A0A972VYD4_9GAMM|nr:class I SAM-dependent methyltransferase [SAR86 cluster bacterium]|tara:strand:- start:13014 stop:13625 length:612 start_codon:yes stop_codon:yes gene_type:complete
MGLYDKYLLPKLLNLAMKAPEMTRLRRELVPLATGRVLEIGVGSGLNLPFYAQQVHVTGVDPSLELQAYAREIAQDAKLAVEFLAVSAEAIPLADNIFDTAVITWSLCTIPDPDAALREVRRLLKPAGKLIFIEHGESPEANIATWQRRINPTWNKLAGGCHLNRRPDTAMLANGFKFAEMTKGYIPGPKIATYSYRGIATIA